MLKSLENALASFAVMTLVCSFGLTVVVATAGLTKTKLSLPCGACSTVAAVAAAPAPRV